MSKIEQEFERFPELVKSISWFANNVPCPGSKWNDLLLQINDALRAASLQLPEQQGWMDIATAPKDADILVCNSNGAFRAGWLLDRWQLYNCYGPQDYVSYATHWQLLPLPPSPPITNNKK